MTDLETDLILANAEIEHLKEKVDYLEKKVEYLRGATVENKYNLHVYIGQGLDLLIEFNGKRKTYIPAVVTGLNIREWGIMVECRDGRGDTRLIRQEKLVEMQKGRN